MLREGRHAVHLGQNRGTIGVCAYRLPVLVSGGDGEARSCAPGSCARDFELRLFQWSLHGSTVGPVYKWLGTSSA